MSKLMDLGMNINTGTILYVTIGNFKFSADIETFSLKVEVEDNGSFELIEDINLIEKIIVDHEDLKKVSLNWMFKNIESVQVELPFSDLN